MRTRPHLLAVARAHRVYRVAAEALERGVGQCEGPVVAAVSGGGDSMALALLTAAWAESAACPLILAYFDHGVDAERHAGEWRHVLSIARCLGVPAAKGSSEMYADVKGRGQEETWRKRRYAFLSLLTGKTGCIITGHTMDDAAETFLLAAFRGGSGAAMAGPRARRGVVVRPLLRVRRSDLRDLLTGAEVQWIDDPGNAGLGARAVVRSQILPKVAECFGNPAVTNLARSAALVDEWSAAIDTYADELFALAVLEGPLHTLLDLELLQRYPVAVRRRVLRRVVAARSGDESALSAAVDALVGLCDRAGGRLQLPRGMEAIRSGKILRIGPMLSAPPTGRWALPVPGVVLVRGWKVVSSPAWPARGRGVRFPASRWRALLDRDLIREPLHVRNRMPGDRFVPCGMTGTVKLKKYLRDHGVVRWERWSTPILCDAADRILWLPGIARSNRALVGPDTRRIVLLEGMRMGMHEEGHGA